VITDYLISWVLGVRHLVRTRSGGPWHAKVWKPLS